MNFRLTGLKMQGFLLINRTCPVIALALNRGKVCRFGVKKAGLSNRIHEVGFNGIAVIIWGDACRKLIKYKSKGGVLLFGIKNKLKKIAFLLI